MDLIGVQGWSTGDVLALLGVVATVVVAVVGPIRRQVVRLFKAGSLQAGSGEHRYARWFVRQWGVYENPYLDDTEDLDLSNTYVSLSLRPPDSDLETRTAAAVVLGDGEAGNLVIEGDPGSGKSTLLKAFGVGVLRSRRRRLIGGGGNRNGPIPLFVQLRKVARRLDGDRGLAEYLVDEILVSGAGMSAAEASDFLRFALTEGRALVLLDGLDEVTADRQAAVLEAVHAFTHDADPQLPTHRARVVVTCRRQNFIALRDQWVPAVAGTVSTLVPLRNSEIFAYLGNLRPKFKAAGGPESFMNAVRASGTLDLHRTPLILAMSVGLYARKDYYEIPNSIAELYRTMIKEMLDRQRFKRDPGGAAIVLPVDDKYRFLREFALDRAVRDGFDDFSRRDMHDVARRLAPSLREADDPALLVTEVADRSGLVNDVSEAGHYVFAHRSIHEHLVAEELLALDHGDARLLDRAVNPEWRQVILFYTAAFEQRRADAFLPLLAKRDVLLTGHCLAAALPSDRVAEPILDGLLTGDVEHLSALVSATTSPRRSVQHAAISRLNEQLRHSMDVVQQAIRGDVEGMLPLLGALAGSNAARIAALVPDLVRSAPDDPRLVEPLWRCLSVAGIEQEPACRAIVERLLEMVMDIDGFEVLQRQEPYTRDFLDDWIRRRAYPFQNGLSMTSNLVTLLAWAEFLDVVPPLPNRYFEAKDAGRLSRVEVDERRSISFSLFWPARIVSVVAAVGSFVAFVVVLVVDWRLMLQPFGWWSPLLSTGLGMLAVVAAVGLEPSAHRLFGGGRWQQYLDVDEDVDGAHFSHVVKLSRKQPLTTFSRVGAPIFYAFAVPTAVATSVGGFVALGLVAPFVVFWLPLLKMFSRTVRFHPYRPNEFIDMYDEPRSRHWLVPVAAPDGSVRTDRPEPITPEPSI